MALWRVRVLTRNREFAPYSTDMPRDEALELQQRVWAQVEACGDGWRGFAFVRSSGLPVLVRGRDVIAVEVMPPARPRQTASTAQPSADDVPVAPAPAVPAALTAVPAAAAGSGPAAAAGPGSATAFLQSLPGRHPQVRPARHGGQR
jgi:hypothetical protein